VQGPGDVGDRTIGSICLREGLSAFLPDLTPLKV
jgi:hypothetical protein